MTVIGKVDSLWRYPVKGMRGEELDKGFVGYSGIYGDRLYAFTNAASPKGFPWFSGRELAEMVLYRPSFRRPETTIMPRNLAEAESVDPGVTPIYGDSSDFAVDVVTPSGEVLAIDDPALLERLDKPLGGAQQLTLLRSDRAMTDCRPISLFSLQTMHQLGEELGFELDKRRFRANFYLDFLAANGFAENTYVGKALRIGPKVVISILERDPRCKMITLDPDTAEETPEILAKVTRSHGATAGIYGAVLVEGLVHRGDDIELLN